MEKVRVPGVYASPHLLMLLIAPGRSRPGLFRNRATGKGEFIKLFVDRTVYCVAWTAPFQGHLVAYVFPVSSRVHPGPYSTAPALVESGLEPVRDGCDVKSSVLSEIGRRCAIDRDRRNE